MTALQSHPAPGPSGAGNAQDSRSTPVSLRKTRESNSSSPINTASRSLPPYVSTSDREEPEGPQSPEAQPLEHQGQPPQDPAPHDQEPQGQQPQGQQEESQEPLNQQDESQEPQIEEPKIQEPETQEPKIQEPQNQKDESQEPQIPESQGQEPQSQESEIQESHNQQHEMQPEIQKPQVQESQIQESQIQEPQIQEPQIQEPQDQEPESSTMMDESKTAREDPVFMACCHKTMRSCICWVPQGPSTARALPCIFTHWDDNCSCYSCDWLRETKIKDIRSRIPGREEVTVANPTYDPKAKLDRLAKKSSTEHIDLVYPLLLDERTQMWVWVFHPRNEAEIPFLAPTPATSGVSRVTLNDEGRWVAFHTNGTWFTLDYAVRPATDEIYQDFGYAPGLSPYGRNGDSAYSLDPSEVNPAGYTAPRPENKYRAYLADLQNTTLFIGGINGIVTDGVIYEQFRKFGEITYMKRSHQTSAFVQYAQRRDAMMAMRQMQGVTVSHYRLRISWGDPKRMNQCDITTKKGPLPFKGVNSKGHQRTQVMRQGNSAQTPQHNLWNSRYQQPNQYQGYNDTQVPQFSQRQQQHQVPQHYPQNGRYQQPNQFQGYNNMQGPQASQQQLQDQLLPTDIPPDNHMAFYPQHGWQYPEVMGDNFQRTTQQPSPVATSPVATHSTTGGSQLASPQSAQDSHPSGSGNGEDPLVASNMPGSQEPADQEPTSEEPAKQEPTSQESNSQEPANQEPANQEPVSQEPVSQEPTDQEPTSQEPISQEPANQEPTSQEPTSQELSSQESSNQEPADQEPADQEPADQEPADQEPADQDPISQEPNSQEPNNQDPSSQESSDQELSDQEPSEQRERAPSSTPPPKPDQAGASTMEGEPAQTVEGTWSDIEDTLSNTSQTKPIRPGGIIVRLPKPSGGKSQT